jgi:hypothetical protein
LTSYRAVTSAEGASIQQIGVSSQSLLQGPGWRSRPSEGGLQTPPTEGGFQEPPSGDVQEPPGSAAAPAAPAVAVAEPPTASAQTAETAAGVTTRAAPTWWWVCYPGARWWRFSPLPELRAPEIFKMLLTSSSRSWCSSSPCAGLDRDGTGNANRSAPWGRSAACVGRRLPATDLSVEEMVYLTAKTSAMVCWLFVLGHLLGGVRAASGQELVETWVLSMNLTKTQFLVMSQAIFILGWPLEWTDYRIFMPIFIPAVGQLWGGPAVLRFAGGAEPFKRPFLSPPVAMVAFYLKGVAPKHVTLNQIFLGMLPFMAIRSWPSCCCTNSPPLECAATAALQIS